MTNNLVKLSWKEQDASKLQEPTLSLPIALGRNFEQMPAIINKQAVSRMVLKGANISRYHALINLEQNDVVITNQSSTNSIFVNGESKKRSVLVDGDILYLGDYQITVTLKPAIPLPYPSNYPTLYPVAPHSTNSRHTASLTEFMPLLSKKEDLHKHGLLVPGIITVISVVAMIATTHIHRTFLYILAAYLALASHYIIHKLCHKHKPWWLLTSLALAIGLPILGGFHLPVPHTGNKDVDLIFQAFLENGFFEELFKVLPVLLIYFFGRLLPLPKREIVGIREPMDGILLTTASAAGFVLAETLQLVHEKIGVGDSFTGLAILITQILGDIFGQVAYSAYFGYFIGLSVVRPKNRWQLLGIGYLTSSAMHVFSNVATIFQKAPQYNLLGSICLAIIGSLAYVFFIAAIFKARQMKPGTN
ncbi:hypothetical protein DSM106972_049910 [Dulcicalothrix desertica PCC 7102]|uniref:FHA domain-containing protein n=1 Tax=Dulcicalothrix desertica PCC 7102 TaxID=232991 RepID=A0A433VDF2_9CYAN|nr:PrsW family glutamic-type intramembrane protease [Dulcicalothrix desertica]RUT04077.1 hypothetical protein DSM106972_049910 [Dulcicalothrix desertica PCC 7102]